MSLLKSSELYIMRLHQWDEDDIQGQLESHARKGKEKDRKSQKELNGTETIKKSSDGNEELKINAKTH